MCKIHSFTVDLWKCVTVPAYILAKNHQAIFGAVPIRHLDITEIAEENTLESFLQPLRPADVGKIVSLRLDGQQIGDQDLVYLLRRFEKLQWLSIRHNHITKQSARELSGKPLLQFVDLTGNQFDPAERLVDDQGVVIERHPSVSDPKFTSMRWARRTVIGGRPVYPNRFNLARYVEEEPGRTSN